MQSEEDKAMLDLIEHLGRYHETRNTAEKHLKQAFFRFIKVRQQIGPIALSSSSYHAHCEAHVRIDQDCTLQSPPPADTMYWFQPFPSSELKDAQKQFYQALHSYASMAESTKAIQISLQRLS